MLLDKPMFGLSYGEEHITVELKNGIHHIIKADSFEVINNGWVVIKNKNKNVGLFKDEDVKRII